MAAITETQWLTTDQTGHLSFSTTFVDKGTAILDTEFDTNVGAELGQDWATAFSAQNKANRGVAPTTASTLSAGAAAEAIALRFGASITEGLEVRVIDEIVAVTTPAASFDLTQDVPDGAVILSVQGNLDTAITAVTAVKVGIGIAANPDLYGLSSALTLDDKIDLIPDYAVLSGAEDVQIYACDTGGSAAGTIGGAGELVRVRIVFLALNSLDDA